MDYLKFEETIVLVYIHWAICSQTETELCRNIFTEEGRKDFQTSRGSLKNGGLLEKIVKMVLPPST